MAGPTQDLIEAFSRQYPASTAPALFRAPGRVNLIGEHTDYNLGFVLPIAIDLACYIAVAPDDSGVLRVYSENLRESREWKIAGLPAAKSAGDWGDYVAGVARELLRAGAGLQGASLTIVSTVPVGSGLSSSAAIEVASAFALLGGRAFDPKEIALLCQRAEREFVGTPVGIMDQYVSVFGQKDAAVKLDCRSLTHETVRLPSGAAILAVNTMVKHELGSSAYAQRVQECGEAVRILAGRRAGIESLRDVTMDELDAARRSLSGTVYRRARHVVGENQRVIQFLQAAEAGNLNAMGDLFVASHRSLQFDYEVSCAELDFLVDEAIRIEGVYGARMTGGGFGGCTVNLIAPEAVETVRAYLAAAYREKFGIQPEFIDCHAAAGAGPLTE